jgi:hypothetical protein
MSNDSPQCRAGFVALAILEAIARTSDPAGASAHVGTAAPSDGTTKWLGTVHCRC